MIYESLHHFKKIIEVIMIQNSSNYLNKTFEQTSNADVFTHLF